MKPKLGLINQLQYVMLKKHHDLNIKTPPHNEINDKIISYCHRPKSIELPTDIDKLKLLFKELTQHISFFHVTGVPIFEFNQNKKDTLNILHRTVHYYFHMFNKLYLKLCIVNAETPDKVDSLTDILFKLEFYYNMHDIAEEKLTEFKKNNSDASSDPLLPNPNIEPPKYQIVSEGGNPDSINPDHIKYT